MFWIEQEYILIFLDGATFKIQFVSLQYTGCIPFILKKKLRGLNSHQKNSGGSLYNVFFINAAFARYGVLKLLLWRGFFLVILKSTKYKNINALYLGNVTSTGQKLYELPQIFSNCFFNINGIPCILHRATRYIYTYHG